MNKTVLTVAIVAGVAGIGYLVYRNMQKQQQQAPSPAPAQVTTQGNQTAEVINAGTNALQQLGDMFGF